eukprot:2194587-Pyramimonas_sp.AAC.1
MEKRDTVVSGRTLFVVVQEYSVLRGLAGMEELEALNMSVGVSRHSPCSGSRRIVSPGVQGPGV